MKPWSFPYEDGLEVSFVSYEVSREYVTVNSGLILEFLVLLHEVALSLGTHGCITLASANWLTSSLNTNIQVIDMVARLILLPKNAYDSTEQSFSGVLERLNSCSVSLDLWEFVSRDAYVTGTGF